MKEIKDLLQEEHAKSLELMLDVVYKCFEETGELVQPTFLLALKEEEKLHHLPFPPELLNSSVGKMALTNAVKSYKKHMEEELKLTPYCFITITEVFSRKLPKDFKVEDLKGLTQDEVKKLATSTDDCIMVLLNHIDGDINILVDKRENEDGSFVVNPEKKISFTTKEDRERHPSKFNMFI